MSVAFPLPINVRVELWPFEVLFSTIFPLCGKQLTPFRTTLLNEEIVGLPGLELFSVTMAPLVTVRALLPQEEN